MADKQDAKALAVTLAAGLEKDLGAVSAYAIAVEHGYEGTEEEWIESLKYDHSDEFTALSEQVREDAENASNSSAQAAQKATEAESSANAASASATAAAQSANNAEQAAQAAAEMVKPEIETIVTEQIAPVNEAVTELQRIKADAIVETVSGESLHVDDASGNGLHNLKIFGKATQDGTPSPENPVPIDVSGNNGSIDINFIGNQLFDSSKITTSSAGGATVTNNGDGSFNVSGSGNLSESANFEYRISNKEDIKKLLKPGKIYATVDAITLPRFAFQLYVQTTIYPVCNLDLYNMTSASGEITQDNLDNAKFLRVAFYGAKNTQIQGATVKPMVYQDGDGTWEPFKEPQTFTVSTPNGLPGIPVESGGNYTDAEGQQWVSDYIDFERGKYISLVLLARVESSLNWSYSSNTKRFFARDGRYKKADNDSQSQIAGDYICTHFKNAVRLSSDLSISYVNSVTNGFAYSYSELNGDIEAWKQFLNENEVYTLGRRETPVETDLSAEEIAAYKALHTNKTVTNVFSDSDPQVGIQMDYGADTKTYIDKKFDALATAILKIGE